MFNGIKAYARRVGIAVGTVVATEREVLESTRLDARLKIHEHSINETFHRNKVRQYKETLKYVEHQLAILDEVQNQHPIPMVEEVKVAQPQIENKPVVDAVAPVENRIRRVRG